ncbi:hypothetical protein PR048_019375 [Dryococelus australis]|uniref:PiggyBac transposable element-derived protein domain-containing protein n=1 Tax=Dryococelus australis TaxID=614101 RepID=A0ABQ9H3B7_9NEOP|nr:hypothetical protein PR048_019375 [Dryococelus australis]
MLEGFLGRCSFRVYIANKPVKYGINMYTLKVDNAASSAVKRVAAPILNTGKNITMDNYFSSISLAKKLLEQKTTIVGTLCQNKKSIFPLFLDTKIRPPYRSMFGFFKSSVLVSYIP